MKRLRVMNYIMKWVVTFSSGILGVSLFHASHDELAFVATTGVHHLGKGYSIPTFYLNGHFRGNIPREGNGGVVCCVSIPVVWNSGLKVELSWSIADWTSENVDETSHGDYRSIRFYRSCRATVNVSKYDKPGRLYVHFLSDGKVQITFSSDSATSAMHTPELTPADIERPVSGICRSSRDLRASD